jgi:hypothetical protein
MLMSSRSVKDRYTVAKVVSLGQVFYLDVMKDALVHSFFGKEQLSLSTREKGSDILSGIV